MIFPLLRYDNFQELHNTFRSDRQQAQGKLMYLVTDTTRQIVAEIVRE